MFSVSLIGFRQKCNYIYSENEIINIEIKNENINWSFDLIIYI